MKTNIAKKQNSAKTNATTPNGNIPFSEIITIKKLSYKTAKKVMDEEADNTPRQWSMHPYCGGFIQALWNVGCIDNKTADKLWHEYAKGI